MSRLVFSATAGLLILTACGGKPKPETPSPAPERGVSSVSSLAGSNDESRSAAAREDAARLTALLNEAVYFGYDQAALSGAARASLDAKAAALRSHPDVRLVINGHADERGSDEYNLALGMRRARAAQRYLAQSGISSSRLEVVSYGEERPAVPGHDERAFAANRRDEFVISAATISQR
jgi:peptidoglycan-associated lipoprotein